VTESTILPEINPSKISGGSVSPPSFMVGDEVRNVMELKNRLAMLKAQQKIYQQQSPFKQPFVLESMIN
jgi:hypothetical protein